MQISQELHEQIAGKAPQNDNTPVTTRHARSTLDATVWLMAYHPDRLGSWLARHEPGLELAAIEYRKKVRDETE